MRRFQMYRRDQKNMPHGPKLVNAPDEVQFEGVVFSTGRCVLQWKTFSKSISVFDSFEDMMIVHGHPEYGSELVWLDGEEK